MLAIRVNSVKVGTYLLRHACILLFVYLSTYSPRGRPMNVTLHAINHSVVKCDGNLPCSYCKRRQGDSTCRFSPTPRRRPRRPRLPSPETSVTQSSVPSVGPDVSAHVPVSSAEPSGIHTAHTTRTRTSDDITLRSDASAEEEADVPREARLLRDAHGKLSTHTVSNSFSERLINKLIR